MVVFMEDAECFLLGLGLRISEQKDKGRYVVTTRCLNPGDVIIKQDPYIYVANNSRCDHCLTEIDVKKCSRCRAVFYCGGSCQKKDWKLHRLECEALSKLDNNRKKVLTPSIRLMLKLCFKRKLQLEKMISTSPTDNFTLVESLTDHICEIKEEQRLLYAQMASLVKLISNCQAITTKDIALYFSKFACNVHTICDPELRPVGTGLYPLISMVNHSCSPNSVLVFEGCRAVVRAVKHVPEGSEVIISYIDTAGTTMTRRKALMEQYFFKCLCYRCSRVKDDGGDILEDVILEGYGCRGTSCQGSLLHDTEKGAFVCNACGLGRNTNYINTLLTEVNSMEDEASKFLSSGDCVRACTGYKKLEKVQQKLYHPVSVPLLRTRETLLRILMDLKEWESALLYCRLTIPVYEKVYHGFHPLLGLQYYTCGRLQWLLEKTEEAVISLTKASRILRVTHGKTSPFVKELLDKLGEAEAELRYKSSVDI